MRKLFSLLLTISICQIVYSQNVGINNPNPHAPLQFESQAAERKIVLYEGGNNDHEFFGFGVSPYGELKYHTNYNDHVFESALSDSTSLELMRITGYGYVGIGTLPGNKLDIHDGSPRTGEHPFNRPLYVTGDIEEGNGIEFRHSNGTQGIGFSYNTIYATGSNDDQSLKLASRGYAPLLFKTNYADRMIISGDGYVGIGLSTVNNQMDIQSGTARTGIHGTGLPLYVTGDLTPSSGAEFRQADGTQGVGIGNNTLYAAGSNINQDLNLTAKGPTGNLSLSTSGTERMKITGNGFTGFNVANPLSVIDVSAGPRTGVHGANNALYVTGWSEFRTSNADLGLSILGNQILASGALTNVDLTLAAKGATGNFSISTNATERMKITGAGNLGLGVTTPANKLDVLNGTARTGTHNTGQALYVTGGGEFRSADATTGLGIGSNNIFATGSNASVDLSLTAKGPTGNLSLSTSGTERMKITGNGFAGFNVATPLNTIDVSFGVRTGVHGANNALYVTGGGEFRSADAATGLGIGSNNIFATGSNASVDLTLAAKGASGNLSFSTNGTEKLKITGTGNFGFGVTAPANKLDVHNGTARTGTHNTGQALYVTGGGEFRSADAATGLGIGSNNIFATGTNTDVDLLLAAKGAAGNVSFTTNGTEKFKITGAGNFGFGVTAPANKLDVHNGVARTGTHNTGQALYVTGGGEFRSADATTGLGIGSNNIFATGSNASVDLTLAAKGVAGNFSLLTNGTEKMKITAAGNLGLSVPAPANKLNVQNGTARTGTHNTGQALYVTGGGEFRSADATTGLGIGSNNIFAAGTNVSVDLSMASKGASGNIVFNTNAAEKVRITSSGKVGIGTTTPNGTLQLGNVVENRRIVLFEGANNENQFNGFGIDGTGAMLYHTGFSVNDHIFYSGSSPTTHLELMRITGTGLVGIGQSAPHAPLQFSSILANRKIVLYESANNDNQVNGFGVGTNASMNFQVPNESADYVFSAGVNSTTSVELLKFGSLSGFLFERNVVMGGDVTAYGNASIGGTLTVDSMNINTTIATEAFTQPTLLNGFTNYNLGYATVAYFKDKMGIVHLRGLALKNTNQNGLAIFTLPAGYRPSTSGTLLFSTIANSGGARIDVQTNGNVVVMGGSTGWIGLDGITFKAD